MGPHALATSRSTATAIEVAAAEAANGVIDAAEEYRLVGIQPGTGRLIRAVACRARRRVYGNVVAGAAAGRGGWLRVSGGFPSRFRPSGHAGQLMARHGAVPPGRDIRMPSFATLIPASVRRWIWLPAPHQRRVRSEHAPIRRRGTAPQGKDFRK